MEQKKCKYCGKLMEIKEPPSQYARKTYCNRDCMRKAFKKDIRTGTSWMVTHLYARELKPDGNCEICGSNKNIDVHHIDGNPNNNDLSNLQRLCRSCHIKEHHKNDGCKICGKKIKGYGYCNKHYIRYKKFGNPLWVNGKVVME